MPVAWGFRTSHPCRTSFNSEPPATARFDSDVPGWSDSRTQRRLNSTLPAHVDGSSLTIGPLVPIPELRRDSIRFILIGMHQISGLIQSHPTIQRSNLGSRCPCMFGLLTHLRLSARHLGRCQRGRMGPPAKRLWVLKRPPRVRIPPFPHHKRRRTRSSASF